MSSPGQLSTPAGHDNPVAPRRVKQTWSCVVSVVALLAEQDEVAVLLVSSV